MDVQALETVLAEVGKAFRLCRFYPSTHPTVQQALASLSAVLPMLGPVGEVELRIGPTGFALGSATVAAKNAQIQEFAGLLYAQGHRAILLSPGLTADEVAALIRSTTVGAAKAGAARAPQLPHIHLESTIRKSVAPPPAPPVRGQATSTSGPVAPVDLLSLGGRSTGVFRPNALPPEIEARRLLAQLGTAAPEEARGALARLAEVVSDLVAQRDYRTLAEAAAALSRWRRSDDAEAAATAQKALASAVNDGTISGLVGVVADPRAGAEQRQAAVAALGVAGERAMPVLFDAYLAASDAAVREAYARAVEGMGSLAVAYLGTRAAAEVVEPARAAAALLGAAGTPGAVAMLGAPARHLDAGVRRAAIASLAQLGGSDAARFVVGALRDADPGVRLEAAAGVARLGARAFAGIVLGRLKEEPDDGVLAALAETLGRLGEARAVPPLADLARGVSGVFQRRPVAVRAAAIRSLVRIGTPEALAAVEPYKGDKNPELRNAALEPPA